MYKNNETQHKSRKYDILNTNQFFTNEMKLLLLQTKTYYQHYGKVQWKQTVAKES